MYDLAPTFVAPMADTLAYAGFGQPTALYAHFCSEWCRLCEGWKHVSETQHALTLAALGVA